MTITLAAWAALSLPVALLAARCIEPPARLRRHKRAVAVADHVNWLPILPPVPPSRPRGDDWMALVSVDCLRDDDPLLHERFANLISAEWEWSE